MVDALKGSDFHVVGLTRDVHSDGTVVVKFSPIHKLMIDLFFPHTAARALVNKGVDVRHGDLANGESLEKAFQGAYGKPSIHCVRLSVMLSDTLR